VAAIPVLALGMQSSDPYIRVSSIQALVSRGGEGDAKAIVDGIDHCTEEGLSLLRSHPGLFASPIEVSLGSATPEVRQRGLIAIAKIQVASQFHRLVEVVESVDDPQQIVASQLLMGLCKELGAESRKSINPKIVPGRRELLEALESSIAIFSQHKTREIVDAWLLASHWGDHMFQRVFSGMPHDATATIRRRIQSSHSVEIDELLLGSYWTTQPIGEAISVALERASSKVPEAMVVLEKRFGMQSQLVKNLVKFPIKTLKDSDITESGIDPEGYDSLFRLMTAGGATPSAILWSVIRVLDQQNPLPQKLEKEIVSAIRSIRFTNACIITMVMSDCFDLPDLEEYQPPPWKGELRTALEHLLDRYYSLPLPICNGLDAMLQEFRCDQLFEYLDSWPDGHVRAYARITKLVDKKCVETISSEATCNAPARRANAVRLIRYLGHDEQFHEIAIQALQDVSDEVRIQAIQSISFGIDKSEAMELITPLLRDENHAVQATASQSLIDISGSM
jgi:hypothetical protein